MRSSSGRPAELDFVRPPARVRRVPEQAAAGGWAAAFRADGRPAFSGDQIESSNPTTDQAGQRAVGFTLKQQGAKLFSDLRLRTSVNNYFAIVLDGTCVSAAQSRARSRAARESSPVGGAIGGFSAEEPSRSCATAPPVPNLGGQRERQRRLPSDELACARRCAAGIRDPPSVFAFMIIYYRLPGSSASRSTASTTRSSCSKSPGSSRQPHPRPHRGLRAPRWAWPSDADIFERSKEELQLGESLPPAGFWRA